MAVRARRIAVFVLGASACLPSFAPVLAAVLHVSPTEEACGETPHCYSRIGDAVKAARAGDTVAIAPGVYREKIDIASRNDSPGASEDDRIVIEAISPGTVIVEEPGEGGAPKEAVPAKEDDSGQAKDREARGLIRIDRSRYITIRGLTITGSRAAGIQLRGDGNVGIRLERNRLYGNGSARFGEGGILVEPGHPGTVIINNLIYSNHGDGIRIAGPANGKKGKPGEGEEDLHFIVQNTIHDNGWNGVSIEASRPLMLVNNAITSNGTAPASAGGRFGVLLGGSLEYGAEGPSLYNNMICGNRLGETRGEVFAGQHADNRTPLGTEATGVISTPECASADGVYESLMGTDGRTGTGDDDFSLLRAGTGHLPSPAIDRGADPLALGLDLYFEPALYEADHAAPDARPVDYDNNRPLDYDVGARELSCSCPNICFSVCSVAIDPDTGSSGEHCAASPFWDPGTQCCDSSNGQVSERHLGEAMTECPDTRVARPGHVCDDTDGCSAGNPANKQNPADPAELCGAHFRFGTLTVGEDLPCNNHDCCYEICNKTRKDCDDEFYSDMLAVCGQPISGVCALLVDDCVEWASTYWDGVRLAAGSSYTGGQNRGCQCCLNE